MPFVDVLAPAGNLSHLLQLEARLGPAARAPRLRRPPSPG